MLLGSGGAKAAQQPEQRNHPARLLFEEIVINNERVVALLPRPELAGFFLLDYQEQAGRSNACCTGGPDGDSLREYITDVDGVLGVLQHVPTLPRHFPVIVSNASAASARAYRNSRTRLSPEQKQAIAARAGEESLRILAKEFGVSYETIRRVIDQMGAREESL